MNRIWGKAWKQWYKLTLHMAIYVETDNLCLKQWSSSRHFFIFCILPFMSSTVGKNVFFTFLPGKTIMNVNCVDQEVEQELARKGFSLLVNRKTQPFPPFSMFWR